MSAGPITLIIGNKNYSSWSLRPWLLLRHFGVAFEEVVLPLDTPEFFQRIGQYSPNSRVPALHVDDEVIWDSLAICETANERWLSDKGWPSESKARAAARSAVAEMHSGFAAMRSQMPFNCRRQPQTPHWDANADKDIARIQQLWSDLHSRFGNDSGFLCGDFGIVDAMFAPVCVRFRGYGPEVSVQAQAYMQTIFALPAMREWEAAAAAEPERVTTYDA
jgi:glutathione S-transferase